MGQMSITFGLSEGHVVVLILIAQIIVLFFRLQHNFACSKTPVLSAQEVINYKPIAMIFAQLIAIIPV